MKAVPVALTEEEKEAMALSHSHLYGMLARIYMQEPDLALLEVLHEPQFAKVWRALGLGDGKELLVVPAAELLEDLAVEYTRLFLGPGPHIPPYESVHAGRSMSEEDGLLMEDVAVEIRELVEKWGFQYGPGYRDLPDHLAVELQLMQHLSRAEAACWSRREISRALLWQERQEQLLTEHLRRWVPRFCRKVLEAGPHLLYQAAAVLTRELVAA